MKAKISGIEVDGTPQEVAELAKLLEVRVEGPKIDMKPKSAEKFREDYLKIEKTKPDWTYPQGFVMY